MHELPITERILKIVLKHAERNAVSKVLTIRLGVGSLSDLEDDWLQHYFNYLGKGTVAEGARLDIERLPARALCDACSKTFDVPKGGIRGMKCPACGGGNATLLSGREYFIKEMEVL